MSEPAARDHYSYTHYRDPEVARRFDERRFGGPIGELVADSQARVLTDFVGPVRGRSVLDVGTGTGRAALLLAASGARVTGVDASAEMLTVARQRAADEGVPITFLEGDARTLEFADRSFDIVVSLRVIMHTPRWQECVAELCRVARDRVVLDYPSARSVAWVQSLARRIFVALGGHTEPYRVFSARDVDAALAAAHFRIRATHRQFVLPIALHKAFGSRRFTTAIEGGLQRLGLLRVFGSPVTVVAERCPG